jgi:hypothetical protein
MDVDSGLSNISRYPLRQRGPNQLKPYTVEKYQYKNALRAAPEAIVKFRSPTRNPRRRDQGYEDEDESQEPYMPEESQVAGPSSRRSMSPPHRQPTPDILQDLPSTDEDEAQELRALSKEARQAERRRRAKERQEKEILKKKQKLKRFPVRQASTPEAEDPGKDRNSPLVCRLLIYKLNHQSTHELAGGGTFAFFRRLE